MEIVTSTSLATLRRCPKLYWYRYELKLAPVRSAKALRFGSAFHAGMEILGSNPGDVALAVATATAVYEAIPEWADSTEWAVERETVAALVAGHAWRYGNDAVESVAVEHEFSLPVINPETGRPSASFQFGGKIDRIVRLADGRLAVNEYKTTGEDISPDGHYWMRLPIDPQISGYFIAAPRLGFDVETILYDVTRKPAIAPKQIPTLDSDGNKIVLDTAGNRVYLANGKPRQSGDESKGFTLQSAVETPAQFGERLLADIGQRPDFYYARREIPRLYDEIEAFTAELWQMTKHLLDTRRTGRWFRNVGKDTCNNCAFAGLCLNRVNPDPNVPPPTGYEYLATAHPELQKGAMTNE